MSCLNFAAALSAFGIICVVLSMAANRWPKHGSPLVSWPIRRTRQCLKPCGAA